MSLSRDPSPLEGSAADWRSILGSARDDADTALALGVELRVRDGRGANPWASRPQRTATARDVAKRTGEILLGIRPLERSASTGAWVQGAATWDAVRRSPTQYGRDRSRWFADLLSIARDTLLSGTAGDWLVADLIESGLFWGHLRAGAEVGIPLVATQKSTTVVLAGDAAIRATVGRDDGGGIVVRPDITIDGRPAEPFAVQTIGHSGVYEIAQQGSSIRVTLAEVPISEPVHALLTARTGLAVPARDEDAFFRDAYPLLARRIEVRPVGRIELPALPAPRAVIALSFRRGDTVTYTLEWEYRGFGRVPFSPSGDAVRDIAAEDALRDTLRTVWREHLGEELSATGSFHDVAAAEFVTRTVPALEAEGVTVSVEGRRKSYHELTGEPEITVSTVESSDPDWFDLGILVKIDGRTIPFEPLFTALSKGRKKLLLVDGSYFSLNHRALDRLRELIDESGALDEWETGPRISRYQTDLWEEFEDLADEAIPAVSWRATADGLRAATSVPPVAVPSGITAELRPYQKEGLDWLAFLWTHRLGGILADDMGLGKTLQLLALIVHAREAGERRPFLAVVPTSVLATWRSEAERFAPTLRVRLRGNTQGPSVDASIRDVDLLITTYAVARLDEAEYARVEWAGLLLDEAQFVKNPATKLHRAIASFRADVTFAITGTPMENSLSELWALLKLTAPGLFASARKFREQYIQPIEQGKVPENEEGGAYRQRRLEQLRRRIRPLLLRRTKELVAPDLPAKQEQILEVELSSSHRALYDVVLQRERQKVLGLLEDLDRNRFIVFRSLTLMRMLSLAPGLIDAADAKIGSRKLDVLLERVIELQAEGHRALVFSQFTSFLDLAAARLDAAGIPYAHLDGATRHRQKVVESFTSGVQPVFLISLKAGGFGLTLTEADYVFLLDPWWNPAAEAQAVDRTHRIGQDSQVFVYRMISAGTIEEKVLDLQRRKARLFTAVLDDEALFAQSLSADDIRGLFED
ncbi:DEAD/DEAH box helicase family protein [Microbacterium maritypicum]|uniref:DEAD/DEAH box helicase n=1 Tax=Microbacterium maritypicum TaxID=33918 RepID=UPI001B332EE0|nr:DEAD/DEAH box helicase [Microbacterium liquefaciens]MBP5802084.1 DEAD/DEAH box helicase family protein [Microbacterium liquefaciens]